MSEPTKPTIPTAKLLDIVKRHAEGSKWCSEVEAVLEDHLDLRFVRNGDQAYCCPSCNDGLTLAAWDLKLAAGEIPPRFTLAPGSPDHLDASRVKHVVRWLARYYDWDKPIALFREIVNTFHLDDVPDPIRFGGES